MHLLLFALVFWQKSEQLEPSVILLFFLCVFSFVLDEQLRKVNSTVHLTGKPTSSTKEALQRLLEPSKKYVSKKTEANT